MFFRVLADTVLLVHLGFIVFVLLGGLLLLWWPWGPWIHLPAATWGAAVELFGWFCPLTPLENALRRAGGSAGYAESFIEHYILPIIYPDELTRGLQLVLGFGVVLLNVTIYLEVWRHLRSQRTRE